MWTLQTALGVAVLAAVLSGVAWGATSLGWGWIPPVVRDYAWAAPVVYGVYGLAKIVIAPRWRYRVHRWEVIADVIYTRTGWLSREWQLVPVSRIQTVDHSQGWLERLFKVATLEVQTASHAGSSTIAGLAADDARRISEDLAERAAELRDDAT
ncbi:PH domain-containing protein [Nocardiopsis sediminis]|uniref:PH domain-containing protein n=1 Tax=Nocardiopsis sediminis TaxID=1778267 RepID=A0ABV8FRS0_9ACTN